MASRWLPRITAPGSGGNPPPPGGLDRFAPKYLVGNTANLDTASVAGLAAGFNYYPDPGDGSGIAAALAAAAVKAGDVWIRPGLYNLGAGAVAAPLIIPANCLVRGAGAATRIVGRASGEQGIFQLAGASSELRDVRAEAPAAGGAGTGATAAIVLVGANARVSGCEVTTAADAGSALLYGIDLQGAAGICLSNRVQSSGKKPNGAPVHVAGTSATVSGNALGASATDTAAILIDGDEGAYTANVCNLGSAPAVAAIVLGATADNNVVVANVCRTTPSVDDTFGGSGNEVAHNL